MGFRNFLSAVALATALVSPARAGEVTIELDPAQRIGNVIYEGAIAPGDFDKIVAATRKVIRAGVLVTLRLDSPGGDLHEASRIAAFVRELWLDTDLGEFGDHSQSAVRCYSACALVFFAGAFRTYWQTAVDIAARGDKPWLGLHRPYFDPKFNAGLSAVEADAAYASLEEAFRSDLTRYGVPTDIIDRAMLSSSVDIDYLSPDEFRDRFNYAAPWIDEYLNAKCGGVSDDETAFMTDYLTWPDEPDVSGLGASAAALKISRAAEAKRIFDRILTSGECKRDVRLAHQRDSISRYP